MSSKKSITIYYGPVITDRVHDERGLPGWFPATTKRMLRIAEAANIDEQRCIVVSSGLMPRIHGHGQYLRPIIERKNGIIVASIGQIALPWIGYFLTPITAMLAVMRIFRKRRVKAVIQYSFYPDAFVFGMFCRLFLRCPVVLDCEDISIPSFSDWRRGSETRPVQQIWAGFLMWLSVRVATNVIILTRKFLDVVPECKALLISGCQHVHKIAIPQHQKIIIMLSGGILHENGMDLFVEALSIINNSKSTSKFCFRICGTGKIDELRDRIRGFKNVDVEVYGFLSNVEFEKVYRDVDVCLALQNPNGRHGRYKVPSKGYETVCSGKVLLAGDMGDFDLLPNDVCLHLRPYSARRLAEIILSLDASRVWQMRKSAQMYALEHFDLPVIRRKLAKPLRFEVAS